MIHFSDFELEQYIKEDVPFIDITTHLQDIKNQQASLEITTREDVLVSCMDEACRIVKLLGCEVEYFVPSSEHVSKGDVLLKFRGDYNDVHKAWRVSQVLLEYSCKMATYTFNMKKEILKANPKCELLTTRKTFPLSKKFCIKSIITGGAMPHRLNLSETIVFFENHRIAYETSQEFYNQIEKFKIKVPEKKIVVESDCLEDTINLMQHGVDVVQMDKVEIEVLKKTVEFRDTNYPNVKILASGGIDISNISDFVKTGIDGAVTSKPYTCGMANMGTKMKIID